MISDAELRSIVQASDAGQAAADAIEVGDLFMGAGPAVDAPGFVALFSRMAAVPSTRTSPACRPRVITDREGVDHTAGSLEKALGMSTVGNVLDRLAADIEHGGGSRRCSSIADESRLGSGI